VPVQPTGSFGPAVPVSGLIDVSALYTGRFGQLVDVQLMSSGPVSLTPQQFPPAQATAPGPRSKQVGVVGVPAQSPFPCAGLHGVVPG
jgi:hypothetical protein